MRHLSNPITRQRNAIIDFKRKHIPDSKNDEFNNRQFSTHPSYLDKTVCKALRHLHALKQYVPGEFTSMQMAAAIGATETSKTLGPDCWSSIILKHIRAIVIYFLTEVVNLSLTSLGIPNLRKVGRVIPLDKPTKPADLSKSYRPISLQSPVAKLLES